MQLGLGCLTLPANLTLHLTLGGQSMRNPKGDTRAKLPLQLQKFSIFVIFNGMLSSSNFCLATLWLLPFFRKIETQACISGTFGVWKTSVMNHNQQDLKHSNTTVSYTYRYGFVKNYWKWNKNARSVCVVRKIRQDFRHWSPCLKNRGLHICFTWQTNWTGKIFFKIIYTQLLFCQCP